MNHTKTFLHIDRTVAVTVPHRWSPDQADAVVRLLDELAEAIWIVHGVAIGELRDARNRHDDHLSTDRDDR
jgi:hypothetical protein